MTSETKVEYTLLKQLIKDGIAFFSGGRISEEINNMARDNCDQEFFIKFMKIKVDSYAYELHNFIHSNQPIYTHGKRIFFNDLKSDFYSKFPNLLQDHSRLDDIEKRLLKIEQYQANILDKLTVLSEIIDSKK